MNLNLPGFNVMLPVWMDELNRRDVSMEGDLVYKGEKWKLILKKERDNADSKRLPAKLPRDKKKV